MNKRSKKVKLFICAAALIAAVSFAVFLTVLLKADNNAGNDNAADDTETEADDGVLDIYATFQPVYAIVERIARGCDAVKCHCLVQPQNICLRQYSLSDWDIYSIFGSADLIVAGGNGLEGFETELTSIASSEAGIGLILLCGTDQMITLTNDDAESHFYGTDPFIFLSTEGIRQMLRMASQSLTLYDPDHSEQYAENLEEALAGLSVVESEMGKVESTVQVGVMNEQLVYAARDAGLTWLFCEREPGDDLTDEELYAYTESLASQGVSVVLVERQVPLSLAVRLQENGLTVVKLDILNTCDSYENMLEIVRENNLAIRAATER